MSLTETKARFLSLPRPHAPEAGREDGLSANGSKTKFSIKENPPMDYNQTVHLPQTDFPLRAGLPRREPEMLLSLIHI